MLLSLGLVISTAEISASRAGSARTSLSPPQGLEHSADLGTGAAAGGSREGGGCGICARGRAVLSWELHSSPLTLVKSFSAFAACRRPDLLSHSLSSAPLQGKLKFAESYPLNLQISFSL